MAVILPLPGCGVAKCSDLQIELLGVSQQEGVVFVADDVALEAMSNGFTVGYRGVVADIENGTALAFAELGDFDRVVFAGAGGGCGGGAGCR